MTGICRKLGALCMFIYLVFLTGMTGMTELSGRETAVETGDFSEAESQKEEQKKIAITFDDGPSIYTGKLLDGLKERKVKATFFLIGRYAEEYPEVVRRIDEEGHLIGNHTYHHVKIKGMSEEEAREEICS